MKTSLVSLALLLAACGSVQLPREHYWRLELPTAAPSGMQANSILRVQDLQLGNSLSGDCLVVADGPSHLEARELDRWIAPLDRLVTDAVVQGLSRTGTWSLVKGGADGGTEDCVLNGRILDFCEFRATADAPRTARAAFSFWAESSGRVLFAEELRAEVTIEEPGPKGTVTALSSALQQVVVQLDAKLRTAAVLRRDGDAAAPVGR